MLQLTVRKSYSQLVHPLTDDEYADLKKSIQENGQYLPIVVNKSGIILDGHHRWKICEELDMKPKVMVKEFQSELHQKLFVISTNLQRRHLNSFQRIELALKCKPILEEIARRNQKSGKPLTELSERPQIVLGRQGVNGAIGKRAKTGHDTVRKVEYILKKASEDDIQKLNSGQKTISKIYRKIQNEEKRQELINMNQDTQLPETIKMWCGDFHTKSKLIPDESVDLLFVDPLYDKQNINLYCDIARVAERVLKTGGSCVMYCSNYFLPSLIESLSSAKNLKYWWLFCEYPYRNLVHRRGVYQYFRIILWYVKGNKPRYSSDSLSDFIEVSKPERDKVYRYQQNLETASYIVKNLTVEGDTILDVCAGSGTTAIASLQLGRNCILIEKDRETYELAKKRISQIC